MKPLFYVMLASVLLGSVTVGAGVAEANGRRHWKQRHHDRVDYRRYGPRDRYFSHREVYVVREYYRPYYRYERPHHAYYRSGYLPRGWHRRIRPYPVYVERDLVVLPHGYRRGIIDGHAVIYNSRGFILDVAMLF
jgi:hypothetical protein